MYFDTAENKVYILFTKKGKKPTNHRFEGTPVFLQMHPDITNTIFSVHFAEKAPEWMKSFASSNTFEFYETDLGEQSGFALYSCCNFTTDALKIEGKLHKWFKGSTEKHQKIKEELLANKEIVDKNLRYYSDIFEETYGLISKPSVYDPKYYAINYRNVKSFQCIDFDKYTDEEEKSKALERYEYWEKLKTDLITVREYPNDDEITEEMNESPSSAIEVEMPDVTEQSIEIEMPVAAEQSIEIEMPVAAEQSIEIEMPVAAEQSIEIEMPVAAEQSIEVEMPVAAEQSIEIEMPVAAEQSIEIEMPVAAEQSIEVEMPVAAEQSIEVDILDVNAHLIIKESNKKAGLISGQILFF